MNKKILLCLPLMLAVISCNSPEEKIDNESVDIVEAKTGTISEEYKDAIKITLEDDKASINGNNVDETDYTWHVDPTSVHKDVKNAPAEYFSGEEYSGDSFCYIDHNLAYYPEISSSKFKSVNYDGEEEFAYYYEDGTNDDYIFATLPKFQNSNSVPTQMMFTEEEALKNKVLHITEPGNYVLEGSWSGQIAINLGDEDETFYDPNSKVTLLLNGVDINCSVAPGIVFYSAYEVDNTWETKESYSTNVDITDPGVKVIICDDSQNIVTGKNIYRMLKTKYKDETTTKGVKTQKKQRKIDAAFYSFVTMEINGGENNSGYLEINSSFEGLDTELHLNYNGANTIINSQDDGINVNEDNVSVFFMNSGNLTINAGLGAEGDGIDSNGFAVVNGGTLKINNVTMPDNSIDTEKGVTLNGGNIYINGNEYTYTKGSTVQEVSGGNKDNQPGGFGPGGDKKEPGGDPGQGDRRP